MTGMIDICKVPFSRYGAYLSVTGEENSGSLTIHSVIRRFDEGPVLSLSFAEGGTISCATEPEVLTVHTGQGTATLFFRDDDTLGIAAEGCVLHLDALGKDCYGTARADGSFRVISYGQRLWISVFVQEGNAAFSPETEERYGVPRERNQKLTIRPENGRCLLSVTVTMREPAAPRGRIVPEREITAARDEWEAFCRVAWVGEDAPEFLKMTWYNLWSSFVRARDVYRYDTMLMSKKTMTSVWSWDHCFNALAMARLGKEKAMEQFLAPFPMQTEQGLLPDIWNPYQETYYAVTKPPVHGWCFGKLMDWFSFSPEELRAVYGYLEKLTSWWLRESDSDGDGIPDYPQGCDSGWDNTTVFDAGFYIESPDLSAYLVLQMRTLGRIAAALGKPTEREQWETRAEELLRNLYRHSWTGECFVAKQSGSHRYDERPTSLICLMPLVLGEQIDSEKREAMVSVLKRDFLTEYGAATEMPESEKYISDGYWRGPIWAPTTYLLVDGLRRGGEKELAAELAARYLRLSERAGGHYENFDALTGRGLRAPGYTWSASVYSLLYAEYAEEKE